MKQLAICINELDLYWPKLNHIYTVTYLVNNIVKLKEIPHGSWDADNFLIIDERISKSKLLKVVMDWD